MQFLIGFVKGVDSRRLNVYSCGPLDRVSSVVAMLDFHTGILGDINVMAVRLILLHLGLQFHVHIERAISLLLAVLDTLDLSGRLGLEQIAVDTVQVALSEKESWKGILCEDITLVIGVVQPLAVRGHLFDVSLSIIIN